VEADTAFMYETAGRAELKHVKLTFFSATGVQQSVLTSDEGTYMLRTDSMEARGHVVVVKTDGSRLTTTILRYNKARNEVTTDQPYTYDSGDKHIQGTGFTTDPSLSNINTNRVHGTGGGIRLPG
jgi:LPS export ABC transporter protein LptC